MGCERGGFGFGFGNCWWIIILIVIICCCCNGGGFGCGDC